MKRAILCLLLFAVLLPSISPWGIVAYYQVNKDYIARVLCENRDKPQLHCDGKCYLAKKLKAHQDRQDKETAERVRDLPTLQLFCQVNIPFLFASVLFLSTVREYQAYRVPVYSAPPGSLLRPPRF